jgi:hypothetical protein
MRDWILYHGTTQKRFEFIMQDGFKTGEGRIDNWLAVRGISLVCNRSLIARRFANKASDLADGSGPVVLIIPVVWPEERYILDLTTDEGMARLFQGYKAIRRLLAPLKLGSETPPEYREYMDSLRAADAEFHKWLTCLVDESSSARTNWDAVTIESLVDTLRIQIVIAAIQEGNTFHRTFGGRDPKHDSIPAYHGLRIRDHIEVCVTDPQVIDHTVIQIYDHSTDDNRYGSDFVNVVALPYARDSETE